MNEISSKNLDDVELARRLNRDLDNEDSQPVYDRAQVELRNISLTDTDLHMIGDGVVISQVVQLLSYIRHAIKNNMDGEISLKFGKEIANAEFNFSVNGFEIPDLIPPAEVQFT